MIRASLFASASGLLIRALLTTMPLEGQTPLECGLVQVSDRSTFACVGGTTGPSVVFEAGMRDDHRVWNAVAPALSARARVLTYDRTGNGQSPPRAGQRTPEVIARELRELLQSVGLPPPYLFVAHSAGGWHVRAYAGLNPEEVAGIILIDSPHERFEDRRLAILDPEARVARAEAVASSRANLPMTIRREYDGIDAAKDSFTSLGNLPLVVVSAERHDWGVRGDPDLLEAAWRELQTSLAELSTRGQMVVATGAGHQIPREQPDLVIRLVGQMLEEVSGRRR